MGAFELTPAIIIGGAVGGLTAGLVPFFVAQHKGQQALAWGALLCAVAVGLFGGAMFAAPVCVVFTVVALSKPGRATNTGARLSYWKIDVPTTILLWLLFMGTLGYFLPTESITARFIVPIVFFALVIGGWVTALVLRFANRAIDNGYYKLEVQWAVSRRGWFPFL